MKAFTSAVPVNTSNRRQPVRQTRTNPTRTATRPLGGRLPDNGGNTNSMQGFLPAITHFTDAITALPKEMIRHYTMLKEVDAKFYLPEEGLKQLVSKVLQVSDPPRWKPTTSSSAEVSAHPTVSEGAIGSLNSTDTNGTPVQGETTAYTNAQGFPDSHDVPRRQLFLQLRTVMAEMLLTLDEKNHVMSTATDALESQLERCESSFPYIEDEISEETRYGNLHHWAYVDKAVEKKGTTAGERTRREAANSAAVHAQVAHDAEQAALRSELRRDVMATRRQQRQHDSDFDEGRGAGNSAVKKNAGPGKGRRLIETVPLVNGTTSGYEPTGSGVNGATKRRKIEKPTVIDEPPKKAMSIALARARGGGSPRETPVAEIRKGKARGGATANGSGRKRAGTNASTRNSPSMASSPIIGTFPAAKGRNSPIPTPMQRTQSSRARQNSTQSVPQDALRNRPPPSASIKPVNGNSRRASQADVDKSTTVNEKNVKELKKSITENIADGEQPAEDTVNGNEQSLKEITNSKKGPEKVLKREETEQNGSRTRAERPPSISTSTRGGKASKTATPVSGSFPEPQRPRSGRATEAVVKRSHKKGAGLAAQLAAQAAAAEEEGSPPHGDEDDDTEPIYCYCNNVSYGEMVACDNAGKCPKEWFHLHCVGLAKPPGRNVKWYCKECKESMKK